MSNDNHRPCFEVRDPIYGFVKLSKAEWAIVNCPSFQRLRDIRQLAMGYMVYPGANHTRFEHSIGCLHLSTLMFDALVERCSDILASEFQLSSQSNGVGRARQLLRLAALLHDVGHPPFSHSGEELLPFKEADNPDGGQYTHEDFSALIIQRTEIAKEIEHYFGPSGITVNEVVAIATDFGQIEGFKSRADHQFLHELLTGELGSDRIDYLLRDAYHSGQKSGEFDYRRLVSSVTLVPPLEEIEDVFRIGFDSGGWLVAEQMIVSRYLMYQSLYFHKTKRIYEIHMEVFMKYWVQQEGYGSTLPSELVKYLSISDSDIISGLHSASVNESHLGHEIAKRFQKRGHFRLAKEIILADNLQSGTSSDRRLPCVTRFSKLAQDVKEKFGDQAIICDAPNHSATKIFGDASKILVALDGKSRFLDDISEIVKGMSSKIWRGRIYSDSDQVSDVKQWCEDWLVQEPTTNYTQGGE